MSRPCLQTDRCKRDKLRWIYVQRHEITTLRKENKKMDAKRCCWLEESANDTRSDLIRPIIIILIETLGFQPDN